MPQPHSRSSASHHLPLLLLVLALFTFAILIAVHLHLNAHGREQAEQQLTTATEQLALWLRKLDLDHEKAENALNKRLSSLLGDESALQEELRNLAQLIPHAQFTLTLPDGRQIRAEGITTRPDQEADPVAGWSLNAPKGRSLTSSNIAHTLMIRKGEERYALKCILELYVPSYITSLYGNRAEFFIVDRKQHVVWRSNPRSQSELYRLGQHDPRFEGKAQDDFLQGQTGLASFQTPAGRFWVAYQPIHIVPWSLAIAIPEEIAMASCIELTHSLTFLYIILFLAFGALFLFAWLHRTPAAGTGGFAQGLYSGKKGFIPTPVTLQLSHDLRTPLNAIVGYATIASSKVEDRYRVLDCLSKILSASSDQMEILDFMASAAPDASENSDLTAKNPMPSQNTETVVDDRVVALIKTIDQIGDPVMEERVRKAEAADRAKSLFLTNMSHDIRTPLNAIVGFATIASTRLDDKQRLLECLSKILAASSQLLSLFNDLLDISRIEAGEVRIDCSPCSINGLISSVRNLVQRQAVASHVNLLVDTVKLKDDAIECDKAHLNQVLSHVLTTALKSTPEYGTISFIIRQIDAQKPGYAAYQFTIKDNGRGLSQEVKNNLFNNFKTNQDLASARLQTPALGWLIAKRIVDLMGGNLKLESEQNKGTKVTINLEFKLQFVKQNALHSAHNFEGMRALVLDDDLPNCESTVNMLTLLGIAAEWTLFGQEAILRTKQAAEVQHPFLLYVVSWPLQGHENFEWIKQLRSLAGNAPILLITSRDWTPIESEARAAGVTAFCGRPLVLSNLRKALVQSLAQQAEGGSGGQVFFDPKKDAEIFKGKRLLLVEDNPLNRELATELLEDGGFEIETAENGSEGVNKFNEAEPGYYDAILMDVMMPVLDGYEATRCIRAAEPITSHIPIIAMTANAFEDDKRMAFAAGMDAHITKPLNMESLFALLKEELHL